MKKYILPFLCVLFVVLFGLYAKIKASEAKKNMVVAIAAKAEAQSQAEKSNKYQELALEAASEATRQNALAEKLRIELENCKGH